MVRETTLKGRFRGNGAVWVCYGLVVDPLVAMVKYLPLEEET